jgi:hypothetical protein
MFHDWGWVGFWGLIFGVHRCKRCRTICTVATQYEECDGA